MVCVPCWVQNSTSEWSPSFVCEGPSAQHDQRPAVCADVNIECRPFRLRRRGTRAGLLRVRGGPGLRAGGRGPPGGIHVLLALRRGREDAGRARSNHEESQHAPNTPVHESLVDILREHTCASAFSASHAGTTTSSSTPWHVPVSHATNACTAQGSVARRAVFARSTRVWKG